MVGSRGFAPNGRFTYTTYRLPTGTLTVCSISTKAHIRAGCGTRFRGMRSLTFAACGNKTLFSIIFTTSPLAQSWIRACNVHVCVDTNLLFLLVYIHTVQSTKCSCQVNLLLNLRSPRDCGSCRRAVVPFAPVVLP